MKYYDINCSAYSTDGKPKEGGLAYAPSNIDYDTLKHGEKAVDWNIPKFTLKKGIYTCYLPNTLGWHLCSLELKSAIESNKSILDNIEWLEVYVLSEEYGNKTYYALHFIDLLDALDVDYTEFSDSSQNIVVRPCLDLEKIKEHSVFTYKNFSNEFIVNEHLKDEILKINCKELRISQARTNEGLPTDGILYYKLILNNNYQKFGYGCAPQMLDAKFLVNGKPFTGIWEKPIFKLNGFFTCLIANNLHWYIMSEKLKQIIEENKSENDSIEWFEIIIENENIDLGNRIYYCIHFSKTLDVLDKNKTIYDDKKQLVIFPYLIREKIKENRIFTFETTENAIIVSKDLKERIEEKLKCLEITFIPVYSVYSSVQSL